MKGEPKEEQATVRAQLRAELERAPATAHELSARLGLPEKDVAGHLEHLSRSLSAHGLRLEVEPASCLACGFVFEERRKLGKPSRCPKCKSERVEPPAFSIPTPR